MNRSQMRGIAPRRLRRNCMSLRQLRVGDAVRGLTHQDQICQVCAGSEILHRLGAPCRAWEARAS